MVLTCGVFCSPKHSASARRNGSEARRKTHRPTDRDVVNGDVHVRGGEGGRGGKGDDKRGGGGGGDGGGEIAVTEVKLEGKLVHQLVGGGMIKEGGGG